MRNLGLSLSLTSAAMAVRSAFKIANVNPVLWWDAESHRAGLAGGAATLFQDSAGATAVSAVEQPVGLVRSIANSGPRKNLLTYSEQFDNAAWIKSAATIAANSAVAPNGSLTADKIIENTVNTQHMVWRSAPNTGGLFTFSVSLKAAERGFARVFAFSSPPNDFTYTPSVYVNLTSGVIASSSQCVATMKTEGGGWWRLTVTTTAVFPKPNISFYVAACNAANSDSYAGDGVSGIYVWGAQLETGSVASDYQNITSGVEYLDALQATSTARPVLKGIEAAPLMLQFDGVDDALSTGTFAVGTLPSAADIYVVMRRNADDGRLVHLYGQSTGVYVGAWDEIYNGLYSNGAGAPSHAINGLVSGASGPLPIGATYIFESRSANLSTWTSVKAAGYSGYALSGRIGAVLITPAQPDATRAKIRKALAKAYQITGVV